MSGLKSGAIGLASGAIIGGATQGISNVYHGRNFWTGKAIEPVPQTSNSASSAASQSTEISLDEYTAECTDTPKNLPAKYLPENNGFVEHSVSDNYLMPGDIIDRYGGTYDKSRFFGRVGDLPLERSLPYEHQNSNASYEMFIVTKPIPVKSGTVAPWFCQPGGGRQYLMPIDFQYLKSHGFIIRF